MVHASIYSRGALTTEGGSYGVAPVLNEPQSEGFDLSEDLLYNRETDEMPEAVRSVMIYFSPEDQEAIAHGGYGIAMEKCLGLLDGTTDIMDLVEKHGVSQQLAQEAERLLPGFLGEDYPLRSFSMEGSRINLKYTEESMGVAGVAIIAAVISALIALIAKIFGGKGSSSGGGGGGGGGSKKQGPAIEKIKDSLEKSSETINRVAEATNSDDVLRAKMEEIIKEKMKSPDAAAELYPASIMFKGTQECKLFKDIVSSVVPTLVTDKKRITLASVSSMKQLSEMASALELISSIDFSNIDPVVMGQAVKVFFKPFNVFNLSAITTEVKNIRNLANEWSAQVAEPLEKDKTAFSEILDALMSKLSNPGKLDSSEVDLELTKDLEKINADLSEKYSEQNKLAEKLGELQKDIEKTKSDVSDKLVADEQETKDSVLKDTKKIITVLLNLYGKIALEKTSRLQKIAGILHRAVVILQTTSSAAEKETAK